MELKQLKNYLVVFARNLYGEDAELTEELLDFADIGKKISELDENTALSYNKKFVVGVIKNYFDTRAYETGGLGLFKDSMEYTGLIQRIKMGFMEAVDTHSFNLTKGTKYERDLIYNGQEADVRVYDKDTTFTIWYSIPMEDFKQYFTSFEGVQSLVALIEQRARDTIARNLYLLENRTINRMIIDNIKAGKVIELVTMYNAETSGSLTAETALHDYEFLQWASGVINEMREYLRIANKKYNDGSIETFTPESDIRTLVLKKFDVAMQTHMYATTFNDSYVKMPEHNTIAFWQGGGDDILPTFPIVSKITEDTGEEAIEHTNIVGVIYDNRGIGVTAKPVDTRASYNGDGGFNNIYQDIRAQYFIDPRDTSIVFTLN